MGRSDDDTKTQDRVALMEAKNNHLGNLVQIHSYFSKIERPSDGVTAIKEALEKTILAYVAEGPQ